MCKRIRVGLVSTIVCLSLTGCIGPLLELAAGPRLGVDAVNAAVTRGDEALLEQVCKGKVAATDGTDKYACKQLEFISAGRAALAADCEAATQLYGGARQTDYALAKAMALKLIECGNYDYIFEHVVHMGGTTERQGARLLAELEAAGKPMEAKFAAYLETHRGPRFFSTAMKERADARHGIFEISVWLTQKKEPTQYCAAMAAAAKGANPVARLAILPYFGETKCQDGISVAVETLMDDEPESRIDACLLLATIGGPAAIQKLKIISSTDAYSEIRDEESSNGTVRSVRVYPVREACKEALGTALLQQ